jgi:hypothetical protein
MFLFLWFRHHHHLPRGGSQYAEFASMYWQCSKYEALLAWSLPCY